MNALIYLLKASVNPNVNNLPAACGHLLLRVAAGLMIFYIHGWHKLEGGLAYLQHGTPWKLAEEVAEMRFPAPVASAFAATMLQFVCAPLLAIGFFTRVNAALLTATLSVAILQNVLAGRDPQLAILYVLVMAGLIFLGGGRLSLDAKLVSRWRRTTASKTSLGTGRGAVRQAKPR
jgi:putative oxidoreductase